MSNTTGLSEILYAGLNNPECAFFTGQMFGLLTAIRYLFALMAIYFLFKIIDKLAFEPFIIWFKKKVRKK